MDTVKLEDFVRDHPGEKFPEYRTLTCDVCNKRHRIVLDGTLGKVTGAK